MLFLYWAKDTETKEKVNFIDNSFYEIGSIVVYNERFVEIEDYAVEDRQISVDELIEELR